MLKDGFDDLPGSLSIGRVRRVGFVQIYFHGQLRWCCRPRSPKEGLHAAATASQLTNDVEALLSDPLALRFASCATSIAKLGNVEAIRRLFRVGHNLTTTIEPQPAIFPGWNGCVIRKADDGELELVTMSWGIVLLQPGKAPRTVTNVRDDTKYWPRGSGSPASSSAVVVPASSYCEPETGKPAQWHWFAVNGDDDRRLFAFPGIWQRWKGPVKKDGPNVELDVYSFLTTAPNELTAAINHERMPVLLSEEADFETWLSGRQPKPTHWPEASTRRRCGSCKAALKNWIS